MYPSLLFTHLSWLYFEVWDWGVFKGVGGSGSTGMFSLALSHFFAASLRDFIGNFRETRPLGVTGSEGSKMGGGISSFW